jgi:hypothetical protein
LESRKISTLSSSSSSDSGSGFGFGFRDRRLAATGFEASSLSEFQSSTISFESPELGPGRGASVKPRADFVIAIFCDFLGEKNGVFSKTILNIFII